MSAYTEDEARGKRCLQTMASPTFGNDAGLANLGGPRFCIASECMAWRIKYEFFESGGLPPEKCGREEGNWERLSHHDWCRDSGLGFCGLAGKP